MNRKVYLIGEIEKRFGSEFSMNANSYADILKCIDCNRPGFRQYLLESHEKGVDFTINFAGKDIEENELLTPIKEGDVTIAAVPAGSKSDAFKVVTAIALFMVSGPLGGWLHGAAGFGTAAGWTQAIVTLGITLGMQGIQGMLAPDPATEDQEDEGYLYSGDTNIIIEGDPVPLLYGELRVAGQPISMAVNNGIDMGGSTNMVSFEAATVHATVGTVDNTNVAPIFNPEKDNILLGEGLGEPNPAP
tara:strand:- start:4759 stop:5496 length:738 start_codon:yes stop_codon:yes gene_type:complete